MVLVEVPHSNTQNKIIHTRHVVAIQYFGVLDDLVLKELSVVVAAALVVVAEAEEHVEERAATPVALVIELVAVGRLIV